MIYSDVYAIADHDFTTAPIFGERRASAIRSGFASPGPIPDYLSTSRAQVSTSATYFDVSGTAREVGADEPRIAGSNPLSRNLIRNPRGEGATTGLIGSGGALPTNWGIRAGANYTLQVVGTGIQDGLPYVDVRYIGTGSHEVEIGFESLNAVRVAAGEVHTGGLSVRVMAGSWTNISVAYLRLRVDSPTSSNNILSGTQLQGVTSTAITSLVRVTGQATVPALVDPRARLQLYLLGTGSADVTLRLSCPQLERSATAGPIALPSPNVQRASTRYGVNPGRMLIEPQHTNGIRNPRGEGATVGVIGSGGAIPTNWIITASGLTTEVVSRFVESGIEVIRFRFYGVADSNQLILEFEETSLIAAQPSQAWSLSMYFRVVEAPLPGNYNFRAVSRINTSPQGITNHAFSPTGALARYSVVHTTASDPSINRISWGFRSGTIAGQSYDFTIDIGWPQTEVGLVANTPALPQAGIPASATVGGDIVTLPYTALETDGNRGGTHVLNAIISTGAVEQTGVQTLLSLNDGVGLKKIEILNEPARTNLIANTRTPFGTGWTNAGIASVAPITGPDGVSGSAFTITEDTLASDHLSYQTSNSFTAGVYYAFSAIVRAGTCGTVQLAAGSTRFGSNVFANFDLTNGVLGTAGAAVTRHAMRALGGGWYWIEMVGLCTSTGTAGGHTVAFTVSASATRLASYTGTGRTLDVSWCWTEEGAYATTPLLPPVETPGTASRAANTLTVVVNDSLVTSLGTFVPGEITKLALTLDGLGRVAGSLNNGPTQSAGGAPSLFDLTTVRLGSSLAGARPMRMELVDWAHVPFVYSDDTIKRL